MAVLAGQYRYFFAGVGSFRDGGSQAKRLWILARGYA